MSRNTFGGGAYPAPAAPESVGLCHRNPAHWSDPRRRRTTARLCAVCPALAACRRETLAERRGYGMWAGVWLDGDIDAKSHLLLGPTPAQRTAPAAARPHRQLSLITTTIAGDTAALVTARSSGNCEILSASCQFSLNVMFSRYNCPSTTVRSPAAALAACSSCVAELETSHHSAAAHARGYLVPAGCSATAWPVHWRRRRWVILSDTGILHDVPPPQRYAGPRGRR